MSVITRKGLRHNVAVHHRKHDAQMKKLFRLILIPLLILGIIHFLIADLRQVVHSWTKPKVPPHKTKLDLPKRADWWWDLVDKVAQPWQGWHGESKYSWCTPEKAVFTQNKETYDIVPDSGILFVRSHKTGSSTGSGITLRIAHRVAQRALQSDEPCLNWWEHLRAFDGGFRFRNKSSSVLWTIVRDPIQRSLSEFFHFNIGRYRQEATEEHMIETLHSFKNSQFLYLMSRYDMTKKDIISGLENPFKYIRDELFSMYNFIAVTERMDESMAVFKILYDLEDDDVIVLSAKTSGGYDDGGFEQRCVKIPKKFTTPAVDEYLSYNFTQDNLDFFLHAAVNRSLDKTIDVLGRERVRKEAKRMRKFQQLAEDHCLSKAIFPCSSKGKLQKEISAPNCYASDFGCGYRCVDEVMEKYKQGQLGDVDKD